MGRAKTPAEDKRKVVEMILGGMELNKAAEEIGISENTLKGQWRTWAKAMGYSLPASNRCFNSNIPGETKRQIAELMAKGEKAAELVKRFGISETIIYSHWREWANQFGVDAPPKRILKTRRARTVGEQKPRETVEIRAKRRAVLMKDQGIGTKQVAEETGFSARKIDLYWKQWARELGMEIIQPIRKEPPAKHGEVITYYVDKNGKRVEKK